MDEIHIALAAERLTEWFGIPITNTLITSWVVIVMLGAIAFIVGRKAHLIPGKIQTIFETLFGFVIDYMEETLESKRLAQKFFPLIMTLFLFILLSNVVEFTPE